MYILLFMGGGVVHDTALRPLYWAHYADYLLRDLIIELNYPPNAQMSDSFDLR